MPIEAHRWRPSITFSTQSKNKSVAIQTWAFSKLHSFESIRWWKKVSHANFVYYVYYFQGSVYDWVQYHRLHHRTFKTADDPYYSEKDFLHAQVFAHIRSLSPKQEHLLAQVDMKDLEADKIVMFQKKYGYFMVFEVFYSFSLNIQNN